MDNERSIVPGDKFRHFKGGLYQIVAVAYHSETMERMVVYQALYGDYRVYVRPMGMFLDEVDRGKYPGAAQRYRFERIEPGAAGNPGQEKARDFAGEPRPGAEAVAGRGQAQGGVPEPFGEDSEYTGLSGGKAGYAEPPAEGAEGPELSGEDAGESGAAVNPLLLEFLDKRSSREKIEYLNMIRGRIDDRLISDIAVSMDLTLEEGDTDERLDALMYCLKMKAKFECGRLR